MITDVECLWRDYHGCIFEFIRRRVQTPGTTNELAEDLCAEVFRKACEAIRSGTEVQNASGWLHTIARRVVIDHYRTRACRPSTVSLDDVATEPSRDLSPFETVASDIGCAQIVAAMRRLTDRQAEIIILHAQGGYTAKDMAQELGQTEGGVKKLLERGRNNIRHVLEPT